jgi:hypothetical protein
VIDVRVNTGLDHEAMNIDSIRKMCVFSVTLTEHVMSDRINLLNLSRPPSEDEMARVSRAADGILRGKFDLGISRRVLIERTAGGVDDFREESIFYLFMRRDVRYAVSLKVAHEVMET